MHSLEAHHKNCIMALTSHNLLFLKEDVDREMWPLCVAMPCDDMLESMLFVEV